MTSSNGPNIKRVSADHGLESITLRSDVAARYILLNEALLNATGFIKQDSLDKYRVSLKEVLLDEKIKDETRYLENCVSNLKNEVETLRKPSTQNLEASSDFAYLENALNLLEKEFLNPHDHDLRARNNAILRDYCKKFNRSIYEVSGGMNLSEDNYENDSTEEKSSEEGVTSEDTNNDNEDNGSNELGLGNIYYRIQKRLRIKGVEYKKGVYKRRKVERHEPEEKDTDRNQEETKLEERPDNKTEKGRETQTQTELEQEPEPFKQPQLSSPVSEEDPDSTQILSSTPQALQ